MIFSRLCLLDCLQYVDNSKTNPKALFVNSCFILFPSLFLWWSVWFGEQSISLVQGMRVKQIYFKERGRAVIPHCRSQLRQGAGLQSHLTYFFFPSNWILQSMFFTLKPNNTTFSPNHMLLNLDNCSFLPLIADFWRVYSKQFSLLRL